MSERLWRRGLVIADEARDARACCTECAFVQRWLGLRAETAAVEHAKQHAEQTGHRARVVYVRTADYVHEAFAPDHRLPRTARAELVS